ncbi:hypothetical protein R3W88_033144 [Solanum pinnatisectum]|uniref:Uncharacterized protein n=1 Tax=Solanum pinnatisectum TaxID=50273 RepID=A0AAV9K250_9SOLN|nr:hypothetical protein R3W88_033144 [Solanum pinnatisectum]
MMFNKEDQDMEDQVVSQMPLEATLSPMNHHATYQMIEEVPHIPYHHTPILFLRNPLTLDMLQNVSKASITIQHYKSKIPQKYVAIIIPTLKGKHVMDGENITKLDSNVNLEMSLTPGGSSNSQEGITMKMLLWNYRGAHNSNFMTNMHLGFTGLKYTWSNKYKYKKTLIMERLDIFLNHCPVLLNCTKSVNKPNKIFRFELMWLRHPDFLNVVRKAWENNRSYSNALENFTKATRIWNKKTFGNIFKQKKDVLKRINGLQRMDKNYKKSFHTTPQGPPKGSLGRTPTLPKSCQKQHDLQFPSTPLRPVHAP